MLDGQALLRSSSLTKIPNNGPGSEPFSMRWATWTKHSDSVSKHFSQRTSAGTPGSADHSGASQ